jgi:hypothetical protein
MCKRTKFSDISKLIFKKKGSIYTRDKKCTSDHISERKLYNIFSTCSTRWIRKIDRWVSACELNDVALPFTSYLLLHTRYVYRPMMMTKSGTTGDSNNGSRHRHISRYDMNEHSTDRSYATSTPRAYASAYFEEDSNRREHLTKYGR